MTSMSAAATLAGQAGPGRFWGCHRGRERRHAAVIAYRRKALTPLAQVRFA